MNCPKCGASYVCPCESCKARVGERKPWRWSHEGNGLACAQCGHTMHVDAWLEEEWKQTAEKIRVSG